MPAMLFPDGLQLAKASRPWGAPTKAACARLCRQQGARSGQGDAEAAAAAGDRHVLQRGLIGAAQLAGDVQAQSGAVFGGGEERPEQLRGHRLGNAGAPVHHVEGGPPLGIEHAHADARGFARQAIEGVFAHGADAILVGGSGLYVSSVIFDFRFPPHDDAVRAQLEADLEQHGATALYARLQNADAATAARVDPRNGRRIVRALEVLAQGAATHGAALPESPPLWHAPTTIIGAALERAALVERLDRRVEGMWRGGMLEEVARLQQVGLEGSPTAGRAIGYAQALAQLRGELTEAEAIAQTQALTRRYARRQVSWFRRYDGIRWTDPAADAADLADSPE